MTKPKRQVAPVRAIWQTVDVQGARLPGFWGHTLALKQEKLYLIGGIATPGESRAQAGEEVITIDTSVWNCARRITTGAGPEFTDSHAAVTAGQRLYTFGGTDGGHKFNELHELDLETFNWTQLAVNGTPPAPRESHTAVIVGDHMVVFGGHGDPAEEEMQGPMTALHEPYLNDVTVFDVTTHTWHTPEVQGARPPVRDSHAAVAVGDRMVIYGGDCGKEYLSDVWAYHVEHQRWQAFKNKSGKAPGTRAGPVMVAVDSGLLMFGGVGGSGVPFAQECWLLQLGPNPLLGLKDNEAWWSELITEGVAPPGRFAHAAAGAGDTMYMVGGYAQDEKPLNDVWQLTIAAPLAQITTKEAKSHKKRDSGGLKMITSYNLFCEAQRPVVREANPNIVPREIESIIGSMWKEMSADEKAGWKQRATEQNNRMAAELQLHIAQGGEVPGLPILVSLAQGQAAAAAAATKKRDPRLDGLMDGGAAPSSPHYLATTDGSKRQRTNVAETTNPNCTIYIPNPSLLGAQVQGKVTGSFQSGYLADVTVNGFTYQAVLFSPYLALNTPAQTFVQPAAGARAQIGSNPDDPHQLSDDGNVMHPEHPELQTGKLQEGGVHSDQVPISAVPGVDYHMGSAAPPGPDLHA